MRNSAAILAMAAIGVASAAHAQDQGGPAPQAEDQAASGSQEIVVTGSRITRGGFTAPTPVTAIGRDRLETTAATNIGDVLSQLPSFRATSSPSATQTTPGNAVGSRVLELRSLGSERTLVLVNGRRFVPTTARGTVDTNYIPGILIDRVDVVTGGASAAYGSDAVAGVVNFILNNKLDGLRAEAQSGISQRGDDRTIFLSAAGGTSFAGGRGHVVFGGEYEDNDGLADCYQARSLCAQEWTLVGRPAGAAGAGAPALSILNNVHTATIAPGGLILSNGPLKGLQFLPDGTTAPYEVGRLAGSLFQQGGSGKGQNAFLAGLLLKVPVERFSTYGHAEYEFSDALKATLEASYGEVRAFSVSAQLRDSTGSLIGPVRRDNPYLPRSVTDVMDANGITQFNMGRAGLDLGNARGATKSTALRIIGGLSGAITDNWTWNAYYQYGRSTYHQEATNNLIRSRLLLAADVTSGPGGTPICRSTLTNPTNGCQPLNLIGAGRFSQEALAYVTGTSMLDLKITQQVAALDVQGDLIDLWAGPLSLAAGAEYRRDEVKGSTDPLSPTGAFYVSNFAASNGKVEVKEAFVEAVLPLLKDSALGKSLELNGAARRTDYSTSGAVTTWKLGGVYEPVDFLRLRGTLSRDIRAPNVNELFGSVTRSFSSFTDPVTSKQGLIEIVSGSNNTLRPEKADTFTAGVVLSNLSFLRGFNLSVDYYNIRVNDAIAQIGSSTIATRCLVNNATEFCPLITRNGAGEVTLINDRLQNVNGFKTRGLDIEASYRTRIGAAASLDLRLLATKTFDLMIIDSAGSVDRAGQTGFRASNTPGVPDYVLDGMATLKAGPFSVSAHGRYIPEGKFLVEFVGPEDAGYSVGLANSISTNRVAARFYADLTLGWNVKAGRSDFEYFIAIRNLFDKDPPIAPSAVGITNQVLFDQVGRAFRVGVRLKR
ncbi:TonB-dependent receptor plug domain-containing protein [Sphingobium sp. B11D3D]|uniref:TonB-dependent receptor plug domain-containing protein n=1 Tax=Sphingobium sp. B11D3D TaxID=2940576 RepID=UPI0022251C77|nr:TonB-dependent receptor [Sphingobium sp. B11D3D]MCW2369031.1 outer membrane receptor protein involved in Fe transport [Sphingobium sp. B11D3D]